MLLPTHRFTTGDEVGRFDQVTAVAMAVRRAATTIREVIIEDQVHGSSISLALSSKDSSKEE
jgi:hypothetical protein